MALRYCCIGEGLSVPLLSATLASTTHPLPRAVLGRIVKDEGPHAALGWLFFEWADAWLTDGDRAVLAEEALATLRQYAEGYQQLESTAAGGVTSEGYALEAVATLGWMESSAYAAFARRSVRVAIVEPLAKHGVVIEAADVEALTA